MRRALESFVVEGIKTNLPLQQRIVARSRMVKAIRDAHDEAGFVNHLPRGNGYSEKALDLVRELAEDLEDRLRALPGTEEVEPFGDPDVGAFEGEDVVDAVSSHCDVFAFRLQLFDFRLFFIR